MRKYKEILTAFIERVREKDGYVKDSLYCCASRTQLLANIRENFSNYYRSGALDVELLRQMFEEKELNRHGIYTKGNIGVVGGKVVIAVGDCRCEVGGSTLAYAFDEASVTAWETACVFAFGRSSITACSRSRVSARDSSSVFAGDQVFVRAYDKATINAGDMSRVVAKGQSKIRLSGDCAARVLGRDVIIHAFGYSTVHYDDTLCLDIGDCAVAINVTTNELTYGNRLQFISQPSAGLL